MGNLTPAEKALLGQLGTFDNLDINANAPVSQNKGIGAKLAGIAGNPVFKSQFNFNVKTYFAKVGVGIIAPSALDATLKTQLPAFFFGNSDKASAFKKVRSFFNLSGWGLASSVTNVKDFGIQGVDAPSYSVFQNIPQTGDLWFMYSKVIGTDTYHGLVVINCPQVAYGTLLESTNSDKIYMNMIRYVVDPTQTAQLRNQIVYVIQSLLGKTQNDFIDPQTFITGNTFNKNIADIPIEFGVDKNLVLGMYINYDVQEINWSLTVFQTEKIKV